MREALALNPNHPNFLNNIGTCFYKLHKYSIAKKYYEKGLEIDNNHLHILNNLGNLKRDTNKSVNNKSHLHLLHLILIKKNFMNMSLNKKDKIIGIR